MMFVSVELKNLSIGIQEVNWHKQIPSYPQGLNSKTLWMSETVDSTKTLDI
jgi:hypothetical protein